MTKKELRDRIEMNKEYICSESYSNLKTIWDVKYKHQKNYRYKYQNMFASESDNIM